MGDDNKTLNQNTNPVGQDDQAQPQIPQAPIGSTNKEMGPVSQAVSDFVKPSEVEPQIDRDLEELGIEAKKENLDLTDEHRQAGIGYAKEATPVLPTSSKSVQFPMSEEEAIDDKKNKKSNDSARWLADLILKVLKVMRLRDSD